MCPEEGDECIDIHCSFPGQLIPCCAQDPESGTGSFSPARGSQLGLLQRQNCGSDSGGVQRVGFANPPAPPGVHPWSFGDIVAGVGYCPGQARPVGADTLNGP
ncbi:hypothetical protein HD598_002694 [Neomicrococcus aestuarii]|uniref:Uncharacterized protein n=1 Tax=Neomicrococcus aestuarii TaxID=556325 RepID=A0A7W8TW18_9MICC|nr:hypothetical protein [Neomicrococcus aestuarii]